MYRHFGIGISAKMHMSIEIDVLCACIFTGSTINTFPVLYKIFRVGREGLYKIFICTFIVLLFVLFFGVKQISKGKVLSA